MFYSKISLTKPIDWVKGLAKESFRAWFNGTQPILAIFSVSVMSSPTTTSKKRIHLPLEKKVAVIREAENSPGTNLRKLSKRFGCGKTQIANIIKKKESILAAFESNGACGQARISEYREINESLHQWYVTASKGGSSPSGPLITEKAKEIATQLGKTGFKGTNGWLCKWRKRYNIRIYNREGVGAEHNPVKEEMVSTAIREVLSSPTSEDMVSTPVSEEMVLTPVRDEEMVLTPVREEMVLSPMREEMVSSPVRAQVNSSPSLSEILQGYKREDIYSLDEAVCMWRTLPHHNFAVRGCERMDGGSEPRFTVAFLVNAEGEKESPVVIWRSENPQCFRGFDKKSLPVKYFHQNNSWMTADIMDDILNDFNTKVSLQKRSVFLLLDNVSCHPGSLQGKYSNIKIAFLSASATPNVHPLHLGIRNFKSRYRQFLLRYVIAKINSRTCAAEVVNSVNVLTAIRWVALAWKAVEPSTITKSFMRARIFDADTNGSSEFEAFEETDECVNMTWLISIAMGGTEHCSAGEYVEGDEELPVCETLDEEWQRSLSDGGNIMSVPLAEVKSEPESEDGGEDVAAPSTLSTFMEAIESLEQVREFLDCSGLLTDAMSATSLIDRLAHQHISNLTQAAIEISLNKSTS